MISNFISQLEQSNAKRAKLIRQLVRSNALRLRSFNVRDKSLESVPEVKRLFLALLGFDVQKEQPVTNLFTLDSLTPTAG